MNTDKFFRQLQASKISLAVDDGALVVNGPPAKVQEMVATLKENKDALVAELSKRATGFGCGACGHNAYQRVVDGWRCSSCGMTFEIIGGSRGPRQSTEGYSNA